MYRFIFLFVLLAVFSACEEKTIGNKKLTKVRINFKNELPGNIVSCRIKLFHESDTVQLGPITQGASSVYLECDKFYVKGTDATPAEFIMFYRLNSENTVSLYSTNTDPRGESPTTQKLEPGDYTVVIRRILTQPNHYGFSLTIP